MDGKSIKKILVKNEAEHRAMGDGWFESPAPLKDELERLARSDERVSLDFEEKFKEAQSLTEKRRVLDRFLEEHYDMAKDAPWYLEADRLIPRIEKTLTLPIENPAQIEGQGTEKSTQNEVTSGEEPLSPRLERARRCHKIIQEVRRIKFLIEGSGESMSQIQAEHSEFEVWGLVQNLGEEDQETFNRPRTWGPTVGYAKILLSKDYKRSADTITDWVKDYRKYSKSQNSPR